MKKKKTPMTNQERYSPTFRGSDANPNTLARPSAMFRPTPPKLCRASPGVDVPGVSGRPGYGLAITSATAPPNTATRRLGTLHVCILDSRRVAGCGGGGGGGGGGGSGSTPTVWRWPVRVECSSAASWIAMSVPTIALWRIFGKKKTARGSGGNVDDKGKGRGHCGWARSVGRLRCINEALEIIRRLASRAENRDKKRCRRADSRSQQMPLTPTLGAFINLAALRPFLVAKEGTNRDNMENSDVDPTSPFINTQYLRGSLPREFTRQSDVAFQRLSPSLLIHPSQYERGDVAPCQPRRRSLFERQLDGGVYSRTTGYRRRIGNRDDHAIPHANIKASLLSRWGTGVQKGGERTRQTEVFWIHGCQVNEFEMVLNSCARLY